MPFAAPLIGGLGADEHEASIRRTAGEAEPHDGEGAGDVLIGIDDGLGAFCQCRRVGQGRARGRLHNAHQEALVFLGNKAGGNALIDPDGSSESDKEYDEQGITQLQRNMNDFCVGR